LMDVGRVPVVMTIALAVITERKFDEEEKTFVERNSDCGQFMVITPPQCNASGSG